MRRIPAVAAGLLILVGGAAKADLITYTDVFDQEPDKFLSAGQNFSYTHDLTKYDSQPIGAELRISFIDDKNLLGREDVQPEYVLFSVDALPEIREVNTGDSLFLVGPLRLLDGKVDVSLTVVSGDVYFAKSSLTVVACTPSAVPEVGTLLFGGMAFFGGAFGLRRKRA